MGVVVIVGVGGGIYVVSEEKVKEQKYKEKKISKVIQYML